MEYLRQIFTPHGAALLMLMVTSTFAMGRIFTILGDLRKQVSAIDELVPHLRAALSARNFTKAAVLAASRNDSIGKLMSAILTEPTRDPRRMRLIYKVNIDTELRSRFNNLVPLKGLAAMSLLVGAAGAGLSWFVVDAGIETIMKRALVVGISGLLVFLYTVTLYLVLKRKEIELNDIMAAEALKLIDTATRTGGEMVG